MNDGNIPVLSVRGATLAAAWEDSLMELWKNGGRARTQYDQDPNTPASVDATMIITVDDPLAEPRIHKCFPGGLDDLQEYVMEFVDGVKDHWVRDPNNPEDKRWSYTYNQRLRKHYAILPHHSGALSVEVGVGSEMVNAYIQDLDQISAMVHALATAPHTRRANAVTWIPTEDAASADPPCLQSIWCRMFWDDTNPEDKCWRLNMNVRFRSRDAFKAAFMNMYGMSELHLRICREVQEQMQRLTEANKDPLTVLPANAPVRPGRYCEINDSYHIYGFDIEEFTAKFLNPIMTGKRSWKDRTWYSTDETVRAVMLETYDTVMAKIEKYDAEHPR